MTELTDFDRELLAQMREDFLAESQEILDRLGGQLARLEKENTPELVNSIFREVHTLKSTAGFIDLTSMQKLAHRLEDVFGEVRAGKLPVTADLIDVAFNGLQLLTFIRNDVIHNGTGEADIAPVVTRLDNILHGEPARAPREATPPAAVAPAPPTPAAPPAEEPKAPAPAAAETTLRVETETLDVLMNLVGELITARNALLADAERLKDETLLGNTTAISRLTRQLQTAVSSVRLVPIERLLNRFTPVIRNLARERSKQVRYLIEGGDTPLDRTVSEQMHDPLVHLLRNAIDHGLESPAERRRAGKPEEGRLCISAERRGDDVLLRVTDDGRGIDPAYLRQVAVARGLLSAEAADALTPDEALRLIFAPGFSTADVVTDISGRGVGMDVVLQNVRRLRGSINVETTPGRGTTFVIQLPLTLAILQVLLVRVGEHTYALPLHAVRETMQLDPGAIHFMQRGLVTFVRDMPLPVRRLSDWVSPNAHTTALVAAQPAVVVHLPRGVEVVVVEELLGKQQMVIKPLSPYLGAVPGVEGTAVLPDGSVTLILDMERLLT